MAKKHLVAPHVKINKHPHHGDPSAFYLHWPKIERIPNRATLASELRPEIAYKMGKYKCFINEPVEAYPGYFMSVRGRDEYPPWDVMVWFRYNLIPDAVLMSMRLPNLNAYINYEASDHAHGGEKYVFTLEQVGWALDPIPAHCQQPMERITDYPLSGLFRCPNCFHTQEINYLTWNEDHGNGFNGVRV